MANNLVSDAMQFLTPDLIARIASALGLGRDKVQDGVSASVPALLAAFSGIAGRPGGAQTLLDGIKQQSGVLDDFASMIGGSKKSSFIEKGASLLTSLLGSHNQSALVGAIGKFAGLRKNGAKSLLGMLTPAVMGLIGKQIGPHIDVGGLTGLLGSQKDQIAQALPAGLAELLGGTSLLDSLGSMTDAANQVGRAAVAATDEAARHASSAARSVEAAGQRAAGSVADAANQVGRAASAATGEAARYASSTARSVEAAGQRAAGPVADAANQVGRAAAAATDEAARHASSAARSVEAAGQRAAGPVADAANQVGRAAAAATDEAARHASSAARSVEAAGQRAAGPVADAANQVGRAASAATDEAARHASSAARSVEAAGQRAAGPVADAANQVDRAASAATDEAARHASSAARSVEAAGQRAAGPVADAANQVGRAASAATDEAARHASSAARSVEAAGQRAAGSVGDAANQVGRAASAATSEAARYASSAARSVEAAGQRAAGSVADAANQVGRAASAATSEAARYASSAARSVEAAGQRAAGAAASGVPGWIYWVVPLVAIAGLAWYLVGNRAQEVAQQATTPVQSLVVGGVDIGKQIVNNFGQLRELLTGITDVASARAALPKLQEATAQIDKIAGVVGQLPSDQQKLVGGMVTSAMATINQLFDKVLAIPGVAEVMRPTIDSLRTRLVEISGQSPNLAKR